MRNRYGRLRESSEKHSDANTRRCEALVSTAWLSAAAAAENIVVIECNEEPHHYAAGHIPGAWYLDWRRDLRESDSGNLIRGSAFERLAGRMGITPETTVVFYGDRANWWAAFALWVFQLNGHARTRLLDGGRDKWIRERRPLAFDPPAFRQREYCLFRERTPSGFRAGYPETMAHSLAGEPLVDVRSPREFTGEITHPPEYHAESALRAGHIPGAVSLPWSLAVTESGTFKSTAKLQEIYEEVYGLDPEDDIIVYCRIGERASHTWFVLTQLLGFRRVRNYDGGWTDWGNRDESPVVTVPPGNSLSTVLL